MERRAVEAGLSFEAIQLNRSFRTVRDRLDRRRPGVRRCRQPQGPVLRQRGAGAFGRAARRAGPGRGLAGLPGRHPGRAATTGRSRSTSSRRVSPDHPPRRAHRRPDRELAGRSDHGQGRNARARPRATSWCWSQALGLRRGAGRGAARPPHCRCRHRPARHHRPYRHRGSDGARPGGGEFRRRPVARRRAEEPAVSSFPTTT